MHSEDQLMLEDHEKRITKLESIPPRVDGLDEGLLAHKIDCDKLRQEMEEHNRRNDDSLKHNTQANLLCVEAINGLTDAFKEFKTMVEKDHSPVVAWYKPYIQTGEDLKGFYRINKVLIRWAVAGVIAAAAFYHALQTFV